MYMGVQFTLRGQRLCHCLACSLPDVLASMQRYVCSFSCQLLSQQLCRRLGTIDKKCVQIPLVRHERGA